MSYVPSRTILCTETRYPFSIELGITTHLPARLVGDPDLFAGDGHTSERYLDAVPWFGYPFEPYEYGSVCMP
jgi:hypothetical protein